MTRRAACAECSGLVEVPAEVRRLAPFRLLCFHCVQRLHLVVHNDDGHWTVRFADQRYYALGNCFVHSDNPVATRLWLSDRSSHP